MTAIQKGLQRVSKTNWISEQDVTQQCQCVKCGNTFEARKAAGMAIHPNCWPQKCDVCKHKSKVRVCKACGNEYLKQPGTFNRYCGAECQLIGYGRMTTPKTCRMCGESFRGNGAVCDACRHSEQDEQERRKKEKTRQCTRCGIDYYFRNKTGKYCPPCGHQAERERIQRFVKESRKLGRKTEQLPHQTQRIGQRGDLQHIHPCFMQHRSKINSIYESQPSWDRIICRDGKTWERVQLKSHDATNYQPNGISGRTRGSVTITGNARITPDTCDLIGIVDVHTAGVWLIEIEEIVPRNVRLCDYEDVYYNALIDHASIRE